MGDLHGYMLDLFNSRSGHLKLTEADVKILSLFLTKKFLSTYDISKKLKSEKIKIDYKNVHLKVRKLRDLNLIKKWKEAKAHRANLL